jgi:hypothetical protein
LDGRQEKYSFAVTSTSGAGVNRSVGLWIGSGETEEYYYLMNGISGGPKEIFKITQ